MKKIITAFLLIILLSTQYPIIFASLQEQEIDNEIQQRLLEIFNKRAEVWNDFLRYDYEYDTELLKRLAEISTEPLLSDDRQLFNQLLESPSSYEIIEGLQFERLRKVKGDDGEMTLKADIIWEIEGYNGRYTERASYTISLKCIEEKWVLSNYSVIN